MPDPKLIFFAVLLPGMIAGLFYAVATQAWRRDAIVPAGRWSGCLALGAALMASFIAQVGWPSIPETERWHRVFLITLAGTVILTAVSIINRRGWPVVFGIILAGIAMSVLFQPPTVESPIVWQVGLAAAIIAGGLLVDRLAARRSADLPAIAIPLVMCLTTSAASMVIVLGRFAVGAFLAGAVAATWGVITVAAIRSRGESTSRGPAALGHALVVVLLIIGWLWAGRFSAAPYAAYILVACAPIGAWLQALPPFRRWKGWRGVAVQLIGCVIPLIVAIVLALLPGLEDDPYAGY